MALTKIPASLLDTTSGLDLSGNITLGDSEKILLGASSDLQIYHDESGGHSRIDDTGTGGLVIRGSQVLLEKYGGGYMINAVADGASELYHSGSKKFETSSAGATVTGTLTVTGDLDITGNINSYNVTDLDVTDQTITLGAGQTEANSGGSGIIVDGSSASILWDETNDWWDFNKGIHIAGTSALSTEFKIGNLTWNQNSASTHGLLHQLRASDGYSELQINNTATAGAITLNIRNDSASVATIANDGGAYFAGNVGIGGNPHSSGRLLVQNGGTNQIVLTNNDSATTNLNMGNFSGAAYISQNYYYSSGHQADDNTKGAFEIFIGDDAYGINYHSAGAMGTRRRDFAINSSGNVGIGRNDQSYRLDVYTAQAAYAARIKNFNGTDAGGGLWIDTRWNTAGNRPLKITSNNEGASLLEVTGLGNVGIGTSSPNISGGSSASTILTVSASASNGNGLLELVGTRANSGDVVSYIRTFNNAATTPITDIRSVRQGSDTTGTLEFYTTNAGTTNKALEISQDGFLTINRNASEYGISIRSAGTRSGLVIQKPATTSNMGSLLVLSDETYRLGTANHYHTEMLQNGFKRQKTPDGTYFTVTKYFSATGSATTNHYIDLVATLGAGYTGYMMFEVFVTGYASGGLNGVNSGYRVCGYSGHSYGAQNYNSLGAGTIQNGYNSSTGTVYNATGLSYHPCVNLGSNISNGQVWTYVPDYMKYGFTIVNGSSQTMGGNIIIKGFYS